MTRFRFVKDHQADYPVKRLCQLVECSRSGFTPGSSGRHQTISGVMLNSRTRSSIFMLVLSAPMKRPESLASCSIAALRLGVNGWLGSWPSAAWLGLTAARSGGAHPGRSSQRTRANPSP